MAYQGGYGGQPPYQGGARYDQRGRGRPPPPQNYGPPQHDSYNNYNNDGYGYQDYDYGHADQGGYDQGYGGDQYSDPAYGRGQPPPQHRQQQDYPPRDPRMGGRPPPNGPGRGGYPPQGGMPGGPAPGRDPRQASMGGRDVRPPVHTNRSDPSCECSCGYIGTNFETDSLRSQPPVWSLQL